MKVRNLLDQKSPEVFSINENKSLCECIDLLNQKRIGALMVLDDNSLVAGIISERDALRKIYHTPENVCSIKVKEAMTPRKDLIVAGEEDAIETIMELMTENRIRHIPVMEADQLLAIVSIGDVIKSLLSMLQEENQIMKDYISGKTF